MAQMLLFPDPRPLVERLGVEFFQQAPQSPGVYLMRDLADTVLYVGKAKNLRKRLGSYRVANPDRMARRHLRLLRAVARIEIQPCDHETAALAREAMLLRSLRPRFNRAGTWPSTQRFILWRSSSERLELAVAQTIRSGWQASGSLSAGAPHFCAELARLLWFALHPERGANGLPQGWVRLQRREQWEVPRGDSVTSFENAAARLENLFAGEAGEFAEWIRSCTAGWTHPFDLALREAELEAFAEFAAGIVKHNVELISSECI
jgi:predicted GIY-YIG superfamily endonuclease